MLIQRVMLVEGGKNSNQGKNSVGQNLKTAPSYRWNRNQCGEARDHPKDTLMLRHICQTCFNDFKAFERHQKSDCPRLSKNISKNV